MLEFIPPGDYWKLEGFWVREALNF